MTKARKTGAMAIGLAMGILSTGAVFALEENVGQGPTVSPGENVNFEISMGTELMGGETTYSIGGPIRTPDGTIYDVHFPISELEWPLDVWLARVDATVNFGPLWRMNGSLKKNIDEPSDDMIDSDWLRTPSLLDVYSNSKITDFDALILDVDVEWLFLKRKNWNLFAGLGYKYQNFDYESALIHQYSPSGLPGFNFYGDGSNSITYDMTYTMPYFIFGSEFQITPAFSIAGSFAFSPWVSAEDKDNHLLRNKVSSGDMDGSAIMLDFSGTYNFAQSWFAEAGFQYMQIEVDGHQKQVTNGIHTATVSQESESSQTSGFIKIGFRF